MTSQYFPALFILVLVRTQNTYNPAKHYTCFWLGLAGSNLTQHGCSKVKHGPLFDYYMISTLSQTASFPRQIPLVIIIRFNIFLNLHLK